MSQFDFASIANEVAAVQADANVAKAGGGSYTPPPKGLARLRFIGYIELGKHVKKITGKPDKTEDQAWLIFELSGKGYEPKVLEDGTKIPFRITVKLNKSLNEKATYYKLFKRMNYEQKATHFIQLLGQGYLGNVGHFEIPAKEAGASPRSSPTSAMTQATSPSVLPALKPWTRKRAMWLSRLCLCPRPSGNSAASCGMPSPNGSTRCGPASTSRTATTSLPRKVRRSAAATCTRT